MSSVEQPCYTLINMPNDLEVNNEMQLKIDLEKGDIKTKIEALKKVINMILAGERLPGVLMIIIRFLLPLQDHTIKKMLLIFWEIVPKTSSDGKLLQEMILVCDAYRKDLQHPNEFLRGSTLRFLCKLKEPELLEPLMPAIRACLEHRHSYVRRNAVLAIFTIYKNFEFLIPDAPELISNLLESEQDMSCKRNAFLMLLHADQELALNYLASCLDQVTTFGDILQLVIVELIYKVCHANPSERSRFIRCIYNLLNNPSSPPAVRYEAAGALATLSSAPTALKAAASAYIDLIVKESDNNVKLIVLDRLVALKERPQAERVLQELVMDILRVLSSPDLEVRKKTLALALDLVSSRNVEEMVLVLKKEATKTHDDASESGDDSQVGKYRQLLVRTLHSCSVKFPDVAGNIIPVLVEFLTDGRNEAAATDVLLFLREAIEKFDSLRPLIVEKLLECFPSINNVRVHRSALWILGEYATSKGDIEAVLGKMMEALGELPLLETEQRFAGLLGDGVVPEQNGLEPSQTPATLVTSDGTYATQSAFNTVQKSKKEQRPRLRQYLMEEDHFIAASMSSALTKLALRYSRLSQTSVQQRNSFDAKVMLIMSGLVHLGRSGLPSKRITDDDVDRIMFCLRALSDKEAGAREGAVIGEVFRGECRRALREMLAAKEAEEASNMAQKMAQTSSVGKIHADEPILISQLRNDRSAGGEGGEDVFERALNAALIGGDSSMPSGGGTHFDMSSNKLNKVTQLTGFSDPVYAEALVHVNQYDIVLDVLVVNQTADTLQNCTLEMATLGDLRLVERPQPIVLAPKDFANIKATVKVASTENGIIFGNIVYDVTGAASDRNVVVLNDIHIDIMDYIVPATCTDLEFRQMWAEFEWENKIAVTTQLTELNEYLRHFVKATNMRCLTPEKALQGRCGFMAANMYAKSMFGEHALANLSIEKSGDTAVQGHIRVRAKSQGMALSLGDKINMAQKNFGLNKMVAAA